MKHRDQEKINQKETTKSSHLTFPISQTYFALCWTLRQQFSFFSQQQNKAIIEVVPFITFSVLCTFNCNLTLDPSPGISFYVEILLHCNHLTSSDILYNTYVDMNEITHQSHFYI